jgi:hypothetical protein
MSINLVQNHQALFVPPVELPMRFRRPRGLFGIDRKRPETTVDSFTYEPLQNHEGLDLYAEQGRPVFAARRGEVVQVAGPENNQWIAIRHVQPGGQAFTTRYLHLQDPVVSIGDDVAHGYCIGFVGDVTPAHLHFEILLIMNNAVANDWHRINTEPVDPLPFLYPWEKIYFEQLQGETPSTQPPAPLQEAGVLRKQSIPMYQVRQNNEWYLLPLYYLDPGDQQLVSLLQDAYMSGKSVRLASRQSPFFEDIR